MLLLLLILINCSFWLTLMIAMQPEGDQERCLTKKFIPLIIGSALVSIFYLKYFAWPFKILKSKLNLMILVLSQTIHAYHQKHMLSFLNIWYLSSTWMCFGNFLVTFYIIYILYISQPFIYFFLGKVLQFILCYTISVPFSKISDSWQSHHFSIYIKSFNECWLAESSLWLFTVPRINAGKVNYNTIVIYILVANTTSQS